MALVLGKVSVSGYSDLAVSLSYSVDVGRSFAQKFLSKSAFKYFIIILEIFSVPFLGVNIKGILALNDHLHLRLIHIGLHLQFDLLGLVKMT